MKKNEFLKKVPQLTTGKNEARMVPFAKGDVLTFTLDAKNIVPRSSIIGGQNREWDEFVTDEGDNISITQLTRRRNGLTLEGKTLQERFESFCNLFDDEGHLQLEVNEVVNRTGVDEDGKATLSRYLKFQLA